MDALIKLVPLGSDLWIYLAIDVSIALALLVVMKWVTGLMRKNSVTEELGIKDNFAFGISIAGGMLSLCIVLSSVVGRHIGQGYSEAAIGMVTFGIVGILLVKFGRFAHDKLVLNRVDTHAMISERSVSVALVDAASLVASAIVLKNIMVWVDGSDMNAIIAIVTGFSVVLTMLLVMTRILEVRYAKDNQNDSFQGALRKGQLALAIEHSGNLLGTAMIVSAAKNLLIYNPSGYVSNVTGWLVVSVALAIALHILVLINKKVILFGMNFRQEVDQQHNVGVASLGFTLSIGTAMVINGVLGG
ncbi:MULTISPECIES: DUF350 domain-containing protein [Alteromonas]|uniref:ATP synthase F0 subunit A n=1 Tax=Alteromonas stellipolaris TaxID=233316 RepID=A0AAW7Z298_9ALTE|nr:MULTISPECIES: DUF350 domain-containing protein [Alteromonas]AMJ91429.1 ATP synthase F0 subunit A [Alteromonas sp. Mac2]ALM89765.1 ATP synthase F0, A subunit [Alteromonas stellipolaris LMG 21856]AMJ75160.1 ATP synthase F0 subunit A [Alteromonas stellipolaris]AMJ87566.1 ATP synthase F0 subunit A [Alteromonas sp. Mac1]AMJ95314.1 ATP synthase F0 subunit A [Alteromonas stellipolaris]